jgi:hypothetical protein
VKRFWRIGGSVFGLVAAGWLLRAIYLYRVWAMASIWYGTASPELSFWTCFSPQMKATTTHGVVADIAFLRLPITSRIQGQETETVPLPPLDKSACGDTEGRFDPHHAPVEIYAPCYGKPSWFVVNSIKKGEASRIDANATGGFLLRDDKQHCLYFAAYRTYQIPK